MTKTLLTKLKIGRLKRSLSAAADAVHGVLKHDLLNEVTRPLAGLGPLLAGKQERDISWVGNRALIAYRGIDPQGLDRFAAELATAVAKQTAIKETRVNPYLRRVMVEFDGSPVDKSALQAVIEQAEHQLEGHSVAASLASDRELPDDAQFDLKFSIEIAADTLALVGGILFRLVPLFPRAIGGNLYMVLFALAHIPRLRQKIDHALGEKRADLFLNLLFATANALAQRPLSAIVDLADRSARLRERRLRRAIWQQWAPELVGQDAPQTPLWLPDTPNQPPHPGPIERHLKRSWYLAAGSASFSLLTTRNPKRALAAGFATLPQPAMMGRELFCTELSGVLSRFGALVIAPDALRRLDRVDCLVLQAELVTKEQFYIESVFDHDAIPPKDAKRIARDLFDANHPLSVQHNAIYALGPPSQLDVPLSDAQRAQHQDRAQKGALILGLADESRVVALLEVHISTANNAAVGIELARKLGMRIALATDDADTVEALNPDDIIDYRDGLSAGIRHLQRAGHTVCFIASGPSTAYAVADVGVALHVPGQPTPWQAHLLCPFDTQLIGVVVDACAAARVVSRQSVTLSSLAAGLGALTAAAGPSGTSSRRVATLLNATTLLAMLNGARRSASIVHKRRWTQNPTPWHALDPDGVLSRMGTTREGLSAPAHTAGHHQIGPTAMTQLSRAVVAELNNPLTPLLALGAGLSAIVGSKTDAMIVAGAGLFNAILGGAQRFRTERSIAQILQSAETRIDVLRNGHLENCSGRALRRGDIVVLKQGDVVPADCRIIDATALEVDTASLTGESFPVPKSPAPSFAESMADITSMLYAGNTIATGRVNAVVVATGDDTVAARAGFLSRSAEGRGGVEMRLRELMRMTGPVVSVAGIALVLSGWLRGRRVDELVTTGVGLAVAAVPEGLPVLATAAQLSAADRLSRRGALVRNPRALEALGRINVLCMDKTGTLTEGRVELAKIYDGHHCHPIGDTDKNSQRVLRLAALSMIGEEMGSNDPMDMAIRRAMSTALPATDDVQHPFAIKAFESRRGYEATIRRVNKRWHLYVKGIPERLIKKARFAYLNGKRVSIDAAAAPLKAELRRLSTNGLRVVAVATKEIKSPNADPTIAKSSLNVLSDLTIVGYLAFSDPVREESAEVVAELARAGVRVVMITGDHPQTAGRIAQQVGLGPLGDKNPILRGANIAGMTDAQLQRAVTDHQIFARMTPAQKVRVVRALQRNGHVVGMVGDGANDAAAMRAADAGIAVGEHSTEAARFSADIVLHDARIEKILETVVEGRAMWLAVRDAVSILVGGNLGEIAFTVSAGLLTGRSPLNPRQLLVVNLLTDVAPSMAIALRPPRPSDMEALRESSPEKVLGKALNREIVSRAITTTLGAGSAWTLARLTGTRHRASTVGLVGLVGTQLGQTILTGGRDRTVVLTSLGSLAVLGLMIQTPGLSQTLGCTPLGPLGWLMALSTSAVATAISPAVDAMVDFTADTTTRVNDELLKKINHIYPLDDLKRRIQPLISTKWLGDARSPIRLHHDTTINREIWHRYF